MDAAWIATIALGVSLIALGVALSRTRPAAIHNGAIERLSQDVVRMDKISAGDMVRSKQLAPQRKRPGLATLRYQAEMESLKPVTEAEKRVAKNTEAMLS